MQSDDAIYIVKLGTVSFIYVYFGDKTVWRCMHAQSSADWVLKREFCTGSDV